MIIENGKIADVQSIGTEETISMGIAMEDQAALMSILSESLYKDPIGSLVRECASNALDAHRAAGVNEPIIVSLTEEGYRAYVKFTVEDFGTGISPDVVHNILSKYAASTKRHSNEFLGAWGLGFKAPLSYTDSFSFITRVDGLEYTYNMYKGEDGTKIDLVNTEETSERNGTKIIIAVKSDDYQEFKEKIAEQLCYFEGVYFQVPGISNEFKIIKGPEWKYSDLSQDHNMHLSLDNVYYEIDWGKLGIPAIDMPIALSFTLGEGLMPTPPREDIRYTADAKNLIMSRIKSVADYFLNKFNESITEADHFLNINNLFHSDTVTVEGVNLGLGNLKQYSQIQKKKPTLKGVEVLDLEELSNRSGKILDNYEVRGKIRGGTFTSKHTSALAINDLSEGKPHFGGTYILTEEMPKGLILEYLKDRVEQPIYFVRKIRDLRLGNRGYWYGAYNGFVDYRSFLGLNKIPRDKWRKAICEFQEIVKDILSPIKNIKEYIPTQDWLEERKLHRKKAHRQKVEKQEISIRFGRMAGRGGNFFAYDPPSVTTISNLTKKRGLYVYALPEGKAELEKIKPFFNIMRFSKTYNKRKQRSDYHTVKPIIISERELKKLPKIHNFISIQEFMKGEKKPFKRLATARKIELLKTEYPTIFNHPNFIDSLSSDFALKIKQLDAYFGKNSPSGWHDKEICDIMDEIVSVAEEHNLWDYEIWDVYEEVKREIGNFEFIKLFASGYMYPGKDQEAKALAIEVLKGRKVKLNWENYLPAPLPITAQEIMEEQNMEEEEAENEEYLEEEVA